MQQVATTRFDIAANGNQQTAERSKSGNSEFSQIFEQNQSAQQASNASKSSQSSPQTNNSHKTDTPSQQAQNSANKKSAEKNSSASTVDKTNAQERSTVSDNKPNKEPTNGASESVASDKKEVVITEPKQQNHDAEAELGAEGEQALSLNDELEELNDPEHSQWVNLLHQLLSQPETEGAEFDDGGVAADPNAVDVGSILDESGVKLRTKLLDEEIVITLPDEFEKGQDFSEVLDVATVDGAQTLSPEALEEFIASLDGEELQKVLEDNSELQQVLSELLAQVQDNGANDDSEVAVEQSQENEVWLANLVLLQGQKDTQEQQGIEPEPTDVTPTVDVSGKQSDENAKLLAELQAKLSTNEEKLAAAENLLTRLQSNKSGEGASSEFIASLQSGIKEFKEQLKAGREPGIDLQSLVGNAMAAMENQSGSKAMQEQLHSSLQQMTTILTQSQGIGQSERDAMLSTLQNTLRTQSDAAANIAESNRQGQLLQTQTDKAINIAKPEAAQQLAKQVQVMVNQKNMVAEIRLDPPDLGSMKINISMQGDSASVNIVVQSQQARDMLEQNTPKLRELLESQGIELGQSSVQEEGQGDKETNESQYAGRGGRSDDDVEEEHQSELTQRVNVARPDGIDYFA